MGLAILKQDPFPLNARRPTIRDVVCGIWVHSFIIILHKRADKHGGNMGGSEQDLGFSDVDSDWHNLCDCVHDILNPTAERRRGNYIQPVV